MSIDFNSKVKKTGVCSKDCLRCTFCDYKEDNDKYGSCPGLILKRFEDDTIDKYFKDLSRVINNHSGSEKGTYSVCLKDNVHVLISYPLEIYLAPWYKEDFMKIKYPLANMEYTLKGFGSFYINKTEGGSWMLYIPDRLGSCSIKLDL